MTDQPIIPVSRPKAIRRLEMQAHEVGSAWLTGQIDTELSALATLSAQVEELQAGAVRRARTIGLTWAQIAALLGVTKQAVHKRYSDNER